MSRGSLGIAGYTGVLDVRWNSGVIRQVVAPESVADVQVTTNGGYEVRVFSRASVVEQLLVRIDDKLSRLARGSAAGEDVERDLMGYLVLLRVARKRGA